MAESLNRDELGQYDVRMLVWMDLEMTGLDHTSDVVVEIATLITDDQLEIVAEAPACRTVMMTSAADTPSSS